MKLSSWGRYPVIDSQELSLANSLVGYKPFIPTGNHRSYGDVALSPFHTSMLSNNRFLAFDKRSGLISCESGVLLSDIISTFLPQGWFLKVTPGTKLITVGGAVASDVHGKNHHIEGCFSECVDSFELALPGYDIIKCSRTQNADLFYATCGGMGLTGVIIQVSFFLKPVQSKWIEQKTIRTNNLIDTFAAFEQYKYYPYSVAWIDCFAQGNTLGRGVLTVGDFSKDGNLDYLKNNAINVPFNFSRFVLNKWTIKLFNTLYYYKATKKISDKLVSIDTFFYPLDSINNWNRIYGKKGFVQFQFMLPKDVSFNGLESTLKRISCSGMGSFLAVLKLYGSHNQNWLCFPMEGYSLAIDFKMQEGLIPFIEQLTDEVVNLGGRVYLAKDALLTKEQFEKSYPNGDKFRDFRKELGLNKYFQSLLSQRLGL